jgi:hypothetical protein
MEESLMRYVKSTMIAALATVVLTAGVATAQDMNTNRTTQVTFSAPVQVPGMTLQAGTYTFRLADPRSDNHIIQILDSNGEKLITTVIAMPARRVHVTEDNVITFREAVASAPQALRFWYYPDDSVGHEFAYPKDQALLIAKANNEAVLAINSSSTDLSSVASSDITRVEAEAVVEQPTPQPVVEQPAVTEQPAAERERAAVGTSGRLPKTASELPLVGLIGLLAFGGALFVRALRAA